MTTKIQHLKDSLDAKLGKMTIAKEKSLLPKNVQNKTTNHFM